MCSFVFPTLSLVVMDGLGHAPVSIAKHTSSVSHPLPNRFLSIVPPPSVLLLSLPHTLSPVFSNCIKPRPKAHQHLLIRRRPLTPHHAPHPPCPHCLLNESSELLATKYLACHNGDISTRLSASERPEETVLEISGPPSALAEWRPPPASLFHGNTECLHLKCLGN